MIKKILMGIAGAIVLSFCAMALLSTSPTWAASACVGQSGSVTVSNNVFSTNTTINPAAVSNVSGVATSYIATNTVITTNSVPVLAFNDHNGLVRILNTNDSPITVSIGSPVISSNGFVLAASGGSITFPTTTGGGVPAQLYSAPSTNYGSPSAVGTLKIQVEQWWTIRGD